MAITTKRIYKSHWIRSMRPRETARAILDRMLIANRKDKKTLPKRNMYSIREFSTKESIDINGTEVTSPIFSLDKNNLSIITEVTNKKLLDINYIKFCNLIERKIGAPNLIAYWKLDPNVKIKTVEQIKDKLEKYRRREKFELKILREICPSIEETQNRNTKVAIATLTWLYNKGKGRDQLKISQHLYEALFDRERDKLFYIRRHPSERMLHCCNDENILERVSHLTWVFIKGNPFNKQIGVPGAISVLI